jgi:hypothetical protein
MQSDGQHGSSKCRSSRSQWPLPMSQPNRKVGNDSRFRLQKKSVNAVENNELGYWGLHFHDDSDNLPSIVDYSALDRHSLNCINLVPLTADKWGTIGSLLRKRRGNRSASALQDTSATIPRAMPPIAPAAMNAPWPPQPRELAVLCPCPAFLHPITTSLRLHCQGTSFELAILDRGQPTQQGRR